MTTFFWINNCISLLGSDLGHYKHLPLVHFIVLSSVGPKIISSTMSQFQCLETVVRIPSLLLFHCIALCCIGLRLFGLYSRLWDNMDSLCYGSNWIMGFSLHIATCDRSSLLDQSHLLAHFGESTLAHPCHSLNKITFTLSLKCSSFRCTSQENRQRLIGRSIGLVKGHLCWFQVNCIHTLRDSRRCVPRFLTISYLNFLSLYHWNFECISSTSMMQSSSWILALPCHFQVSTLLLS
jgi:hypothetical protein